MSQGPFINYVTRDRGGGGGKFQVNFRHTWAWHGPKYSVEADKKGVTGGWMVFRSKNGRVTGGTIYEQPLTWLASSPAATFLPPFAFLPIISRSQASQLDRNTRLRLRYKYFEQKKFSARKLVFNANGTFGVEKTESIAECSATDPAKHNARSSKLDV